MAQQTAVEWLYERLERMIPRTDLYNIDKREYFQQAKEMEKQQIIDAYKSSHADADFIQELAENNANKYYKETYGGNNE
jgi:hypothetical protein